MFWLMVRSSCVGSSDPDEVTALIAQHLLDALLAAHAKHRQAVDQNNQALSSTSASHGDAPADGGPLVAKPLYEEWPVYPKGMGVVCVAPDGIRANELIAEYFGEVYPPWRWFEKEDAAKDRSRRPGAARGDDFYNIMLERHRYEDGQVSSSSTPSMTRNVFTSRLSRDDALGYDVLFVDPIRKGNFASRMSHSCSPNCSTVVMSAGGRFVIGMYATRDIAFSEELTFDYNSVTESEDEHRAAVCLCGTRACRGSFVALAAADTYMQVLAAQHDLAHRTRGLLRAGLVAASATVTGTDDAAAATAQTLTLTQPLTLTPDEQALLDAHSVRQSVRLSNFLFLSQHAQFMT